jgi:hypothetical protein
MSAVTMVSIWKPRDGRIPEFTTNLAKAKKIQERLGGRVRVWQSNFGGQPLTFIYTIEVGSWKAFGEFGEKLQSDPEWQKFWTEAAAKPSADQLQSSVISEAPGL